METSREENTIEREKRQGKPGISIIINDQHYFAPKSPMTGAELKALASIPVENRMFRDEKGNKPDTPIGDDMSVDLHAGDKFYDLPPGVVG